MVVEYPDDAIVTIPGTENGIMNVINDAIDRGTLQFPVDTCIYISNTRESKDDDETSVSEEYSR